MNDKSTLAEGARDHEAGDAVHGASPDRHVDCLQPPANVAKADQVGVFVIFDADRDGDLYELLREQSDNPSCEFSVIGGSKGSSDTEAGRESVRRWIGKADQVIVICGEHADASPHIHTELLIAQDEQKPYFLLWGRRGVMCTKPIGAKRDEGMYSWTLQFLHDRIAFNVHDHCTEMEARSLRRKPYDARMPPCTPPPEMKPVKTRRQNLTPR
jgi:hypothetical protein